MADAPLPVTVNPLPRQQSRLKLGQRRLRSLPDPALSGNWITHVEGDTVEVIVEHATQGTYVGDAVGRPAGGTMRWYPTMQDLEPLVFVFYEVHDYRVTKWLNSWKREVYDPETGVYGVPGNTSSGRSDASAGYRRQFETEYLKYGSDDPVMKRTYLGCFPLHTQQFELSYQEVDGRLTVSGQFRANRLIETFL